MKPDDNDKLWELLGKARQPVVSPFFARNVLRSIRQEEEARPPRAFFRLTRSLRPLHRWAWRSALAATCAVAALSALFTVAPNTFNTFVRHHHTQDLESAGISKQIAGDPDYEVIQHLDELVADEQNSVWLDDSVH